MKNSKIAVFQKKEIRKTIHDNEWWFVINDIIAALTESKDPAQYFKRMKVRDKVLKKLTEQGEVQFVPPHRLEKKTKKRVSTRNNYLNETQKTKKIDS